MASTRRLAAIFAADLVGYSRLIGSDEEGTLRRFRALKEELIDPKIAEHGGRLVKTTGDGLLVEFSSVVGALRCAIEMQAGVEAREAGKEDHRLQFRIGIHQGDIIVDEMEDIHGNEVNIAARLEGLAEPGGICVSDRVREDAIGRIEIDFEDIGAQPLKNIARPPRRIFWVRPRVSANDEALSPIFVEPLPVEPARRRPSVRLPLGRRTATMPKPVRRRSSNSALARLFAEPRRFRFDAAIRLLMRAARSTEPADSAVFRTPPGLAYPAADIAAIERPGDGQPPKLTTTVIGLTGPSGVLPRFYTEMVTQTLRSRSRAMHDFFDMLAHRVVAMFAQAGIKYRLNRAAETATNAAEPERDKIGEALLAFTGYGTPHLVSRLTVGAEPLMHYAGLFAGRPRSAEALGALASDWLGREVEVEQFAGAWLPLSKDQCTALAHGRVPGAWNRLGVDAAIGARAWDPQARIVLRIGPLDRTAFAALLPDQPGLQRLVSLVRAFLGLEIGFAINPVLAGPEVGPLSLAPDATPGPRLGWNTWMPPPEPPLAGITPPDAADAIFEAEVVEAEERARSS